MPCFSPSHTPNPSSRNTQWKQGLSSQKRNTQPLKEDHSLVAIARCKKKKLTLKQGTAGIYKEQQGEGSWRGWESQAAAAAVHPLNSQ